MEKTFSSSWKGSKDPGKQRKYALNAPSHVKSKMLASKLSDDLAKKFSKRSARVIKGDRVKVLRGQFKGKTGKIERVDIDKGKVLIEKVELQKKDGTKKPYPIHHSNLMITEFNLNDKKRAEILKRK
jgi:large subunit ribosomal protein L24